MLKITLFTLPIHFLRTALVQNSDSVEGRRVWLEIVDNIEEGGWELWEAVSTALSLAPENWVARVNAPVQVMREGRKEHLRTIWEFLSDSWLVNYGERRFDKTDGERGWAALERLMDQN